MRRATLRREVGACQSLVTLGQPRAKRTAASRGEPAIPAIHALHLADVVARWGISRRTLLRGVIADDRLDAIDAQISLPVLERLVARARALTGEPALGFHVGLQMRISAHGYLGFAAMASSTVGEALALAAKFAPTRTSALALRIERRGARAFVVIEERADFGTARDAVLVALMVGIWQIGNALTGRELRGHAELAIPAPDYAARLARIAPGVRFDRAENRLVFDAATLAFPLVMADPAALRLARDQCERALEALGRCAIAGRVQAAIAQQSGAPCSVADAAALLGLSERTLKRRLREEGVTFSALIDAHRRDRAVALLASDLSLDAIAERVGYSDPANFGRAFRRWTGTSPGARRRTLPRLGDVEPSFPRTLRIEPEGGELRDDHGRHRVVKEAPRVASIAEAERGRFGARPRIRVDVRELVALEVREGDREIARHPRALTPVPLGRRVRHEPPAEARVSDLVREDPREQAPELAVRHREALGADQRDGDRLAETADGEHVAEGGFAGGDVVVARDDGATGPDERRFAAERLDDGAAEDAVRALFVRERAALLEAVEAGVGELRGERLEHARGPVLVDHPPPPRRDRGGDERGQRGDGGPARAGGAPEIDARFHHAHPIGIAGGGGGPHGVHVGPIGAGCSAPQHAERTFQGST